MLAPTIKRIAEFINWNNRKSDEGTNAHAHDKKNCPDEQREKDKMIISEMSLMLNKGTVPRAPTIKRIAEFINWNNKKNDGGTCANTNYNWRTSNARPYK